jgi:hypothetical protein
MKTIAIKTFPILPACFFLTLALGSSSCNGDEDKNKEPENTETRISVTIDHPQYSNGALNVIKDLPVSIGASHVKVDINPPQEYTVEFVAESNDYFTFTAEGVLTGLKAGTAEEEVGSIIVRVKASSGKQLSETIPVKVVGMLVAIVNHENYVDDTFRVVAKEEFILTKAHVKVEPERPDYSIAFAPKTTRYFSFGSDGILHGVLDGTETIEVLVLSGSDTLKVQPFNVRVSPAPDWVTAVTGSASGKKTIYALSTDLGKPMDVGQYFTVTGGGNRALRYTSSNTDVATVDPSTGMVTINNVPSYAFIRATATDGSQRADSIRVTTALDFPGRSRDWNLCNILTHNNELEDGRYTSPKVWDGDVATAWVYRVDKAFTRPRYPNAHFLMGVYGKTFMPGDANEWCSDWVLGGAPILKKDSHWGVWAANMDAPQVLKKLVVTRGFYTDERGLKIYQSGTMYLELWDNENKKMRMLGKRTFTGDPRDNEWVIDLTQGDFKVYNTSSDPAFESETSYSSGMPGTELQMMFSTEGASSSGGSCYWAIADVLLFE